MPPKKSTKGETKKRTKATKDPNAPKKPLSAYMFFCADKRPEVKEEQPDLKPPQVLKALGEKWREISEEDKKPYEKKAEEDKKRYAEALEEYEAGKGLQGRWQRQRGGGETRQEGQEGDC
eukprot:TRINITY_DN631_c0_g1_i4.p2 TRINITY_DN631_c0_g1~~TRINITY_DN631_c0_g1_i4.p2  ORF type:complete len:140 (-),score=64.84 TRINITY_DN631_c0_g1_i4:231-590(-)